MPQNHTTFQIFTDGACSGNPGAGGWGVRIHSPDGNIQEYSQGYIRTTNNRMELRAVISALSHIPVGAKALVTTDSQYVVNAIEKGWLVAWQKKHWKTAQKKPVANQDLWVELLPLLSGRQVSFTWIRGHEGHAENERCDKLAVEAYQQPNLITDEGFLGDVHKNTSLL